MTAWATSLTYVRWAEGQFLTFPLVAFYILPISHHTTSFELIPPCLVHATLLPIIIESMALTPHLLSLPLEIRQAIWEEVFEYHQVPTIHLYHPKNTSCVTPLSTNSKHERKKYTRNPIQEFDDASYMHIGRIQRIEPPHYQVQSLQTAPRIRNQALLRVCRQICTETTGVLNPRVDLLTTKPFPFPDWGETPYVTSVHITLDHPEEQSSRNLLNIAYYYANACRLRSLRLTIQLPAYKHCHDNVVSELCNATGLLRRCMPTSTIIIVILRQQPGFLPQHGNRWEYFKQGIDEYDFVDTLWLRLRMPSAEIGRSVSRHQSLFEIFGTSVGPNSYHICFPIWSMSAAGRSLTGNVPLVRVRTRGPHHWSPDCFWNRQNGC